MAGPTKRPLTPEKPIARAAPEAHATGRSVLRGVVNDELLAQKTYLEQLFDAAPEAMIIRDRDHLITRVNEEFTRVFGYTREESLGRTLDELIVSPEKLEESLLIARELDAGRTVSLETTRRTKDGTLLDVSLLGKPLSLEGETSSASFIYRDISDRKRSEKLQSALYQIAETASSAVDLQQLYASIHAILRELMYAENCYIALYDAPTQSVTFPYYVDERDPPPAPRRGGRGLTEHVLRSGQPLLATPELLEDLAKRGEVARVGTHSLDWMGVPLKEGDATFGALVVQSYRQHVRYAEKEKEILTFVSQQIARAIQHKRTLEVVRESESKFRALAENAVPGIFIVDSEKVLYANPSCEQIFGYSREELAWVDPWSLVHNDSRELVRSRNRSRLQGEVPPARYEFRVFTKAGEVRWLDLSASAIQFEGRPAVVATAVDITERKRAEELQSALYRIAESASSSEDLQDCFRTIHKIVGELMFAGNFYIAFYHPEQKAISFPYAVDEVDTFADPETLLPLRHGLTEYVLRTGQPLLAPPDVFEEICRQGEAESIGAPSIDWLGVPLKKGSETFGVLVVQSYTEKTRYTEKEKDILTFVSQQISNAIVEKRSQQALRESEGRYRSLVQSAVHGIFRCSADGKFLSANPAMVAMLGYASEDELLGIRVPGDLWHDPADLARQMAEHGGSSLVENVDIAFKKKDGHPVTVRVNGRIELDAKGAPFRFEGIAEDVTERRQLEQQLRQAQKMDAVGRLAGGVAHDFNNLLTVIKGYSEMILGDLPLADPLRNEVEEIKRAADRAASLTRQLLAFSRQQVLAPKVLDLNSVVTNMDRMLRRLLGEDIELSTLTANELGSIKADPGQVEQVIMNLAVNARDAMPKGGMLTIETANVELDETYLREYLSLPAGSYVQLAVSDTGIGMTAEVRSRIFEPFYTTKELGKGTGLGLSTVYGIVKQSGGDIWVYSEPGVGTTFKVFFPRVDGGAAGAQLAAEPAQRRGTETILLVEDEDGVRMLVRQILQKNGYTVLEASHGAQALDIFKSHSGPINLLLTDVVLPHMGGNNLAQQIRQVKPDTRVLYMSGYTAEATLRDVVVDSKTAFVQKPFTSDALAQKVREVLEG